MITITEIQKAKFVTHAGSFHADDVFSTVFLEDMFGTISLARVNEVHDVSKEQIVYDIGGGAFDHHSSVSKLRDNFIPYASLGLLFEYYGKEYLKKKNISAIQEVYDTFVQDFIMQIDAIDNGIFPKKETYSFTTISEMIELFCPTYLEDFDYDSAFLQAIDIARKIWQRFLKQAIAKVEAKTYVLEAIKNCNDEILILEKHVPFMETILTSSLKQAKKLLYVISPSNREGYCIRAINKSLKTKENRLDFPKEWAGKRDKELEECTKIKQVTFCHRHLFLACALTKEASILLAKKSIELQKEK